jgi:hypothetical protein
LISSCRSRSCKASSGTIDPEDDEIDDEESWTNICKVAGKHAGISAERAEAIHESEGFHAYGHTGIVEAVEVVVAVGRDRNPFVSAVVLPPPNSKARNS